MNDNMFSGDSFTAETLTLSINRLPYRPRLIGAMRLFEEGGIATTTALIEFKNHILSLVPARPRGAPGAIYTPGKRQVLTFEAPHLLIRSTILADTIQNVRAFGGAELSNIEEVRDERLMGMRTSLENTLEYHRIGAIKGQVIDAEGALLVDLFAEFGVTQQTLSMAFSVGTTNVRNKVVEAKRLAEEALGDVQPARWVVVSSPTFFDALMGHPAIEPMVSGWSAAELLREDKRSAASIAGVEFIEYRGTVGGTPYIADGEAYLIPVGVPGLFITRFAPADYEETVNTVGLPLYSKANLLPFNRGAQLEAQSNPVNLCTRPRAVVKLTA